MGIIKYNGISSESFGIIVEHLPNYQMAEKDYTITHVEGMNGDLIQDNKSYKNVNRDYQIATLYDPESFVINANKVSEWLNSPNTYSRLEDTYEPLYYRKAIFQGPLDIENILGKVGRATISFNCKPQRFLKSGEKKISFDSSGKIENPTSFSALPIITVHGSGSGTISIGSYIVTISDINTNIVINSVIQDAYWGSENRNSDIFCDEFPKIERGINNVSFTGGITSIDIIPNWWTR